MEEIIIDEKKSSYNEASFKMKRLHELQDECNNYRKNPHIMCKNRKFGFENHYFSIQSLYLEISSKLSEDEKKKLKPILKEISEIIIKLKKCFTTGDYAFENKYIKTEESEKIKESFNEKLFDAEEEVRNLLDKHGFSTMNQEGDSGDRYN